MKFLFFNIIILLFFVGCGQKRERADLESSASGNITRANYAPVEYIKWVESKEGLRASKKIDKIEFQLQYMPAEYMAAKDNIDSLDLFNEAKLKTSVKTYDQLQYFKLKISIDEFHDEIIKYNIKNDFEYEDRVKYYSFNMQRRLWLIDGNDTLPCVMFNYERTFNLTPNSNFQVAFPASPGKASKTLIIDDVYLGTGKVMLTIEEDRINSIPKILF